MAIVTDGLVLYLHGACGKNNPATRVWKDLSGNGNDGQLINFGYTEDSGWVDGGLRFDGVDDYVDCGSIFNEDYEGFTVETTIIFSEKSLGPGNIGYIVHKNISQMEGNAPFVLMTRDSNIVWQVNSSSNDYLRIYAGGYMDGKPHLVHGIYSNNKIMLYVDGVLKSERAVKPFENNNGKIGIGSSCYSGQYDRPFKGEIHSIRLYNRALTDEEIMQNYQAGHEWTPQIGKREATTTMKPITTSLSRKGKGKRELISTMKPITTSLERKGKGKREVISTMKPITSSLSRKGVGRREVTTTIKPITSSIFKKLPPIHADIDIKERIPKLEVD